MDSRNACHNTCGVLILPRLDCSQQFAGSTADVEVLLCMLAMPLTSKTDCCKPPLHCDPPRHNPEEPQKQTASCDVCVAAPLKVFGISTPPSCSAKRSVKYKSISIAGGLLQVWSAPHKKHIRTSHVRSPSPHQNSQPRLAIPSVSSLHHTRFQLFDGSLQPQQCQSSWPEQDHSSSLHQLMDYNEQQQLNGNNRWC